MKTLNQLLTEKTFNLDKDVEFIFKKYFEPNLKKIAKGTFRGSWPKSKLIYSKDLKTRDAKAAHKLNPIKIRTWTHKGNFYSPDESLIEVGPDMEIISFLIKNIKDEEKMAEFEKQLYGKISIENALSPTDIRDGIYHELSHWVDDTLHNFHISDGNNQVSKGATGAIDSLPEVNAVVHGMKIFRKDLGKKKWDKLTFKELINLIPILSTTEFEAMNYGKLPAVKLWKKRLLKRMNRENLLGKNMR